MSTSEEARGISGSKARILLVDDDERNLLALSQVLEPIAEVVCSPSGRDALRQLLGGEFAVILLDVFMPDLDGYETAALIRQREQTSRIPIIFLSAVNKETEHLMRGYEMGAVDYVFKPVDPMVLKSKVSVFVDLFDMRRQLEDSERRQASILRALPMAIYEAVEASGSIPQLQFVGGDLVHFLGDQAEALLEGERRWEDWVHPQDRRRLERQLAAAEETITVEYRWVGPDGAKRHLLDQRVVTGSGSPRRWAGTLIDITDRKELEARLVHAGKLDALGQLTGGVAHDFNNLLAAMLSGINLLQRRLKIGDNEQRIIDHMRHAAEQGTELVRRMMSFARQQDLSPASVDPAQIYDTVAGLVKHTLGGMVTVTWKKPETDLNLFVDRAQLELALMNIIINARDAMSGGGEIEVSVTEWEATEGGEPMLRIRVADSGCGIPEETLERVTEPFFTTKDTGKGTGLGLSMVSGFVNQSGGEIRIESVVGEGTQIDLILPATDDGAAVKNSPNEGSLPWLVDKRLLLIDDDDAVRAVLSEELREAGGLIDHFATGREAIAAVENAPDKYDFILSDFAMPDLDGLEALRQIGDLAPKARSALMTGNPDDARLTRLDIPVVRKPLTLSALTDAFQAGKSA